MAGKERSLNELLAPISRRLGRSCVPRSVELPDFGPQPVRVTDGLSQAELVEKFVGEAEKVKVRVHRCSASELAATIAAIAGSGEPGSGEAGSVVCADDERFAREGLAEALRAEEKVTTVTTWKAEESEASIEAAATALYGITYASAAIAESGTVVQESAPRCGRAVSLLPLVHVAVVDAATIRPTMLEIMQAYAEADAGLPSQICLITGPSATADIELVRVDGVHGPMYVHYVIVG